MERKWWPLCVLWFLMIKDLFKTADGMVAPFAWLIAVGMICVSPLLPLFCCCMIPLDIARYSYYVVSDKKKRDQDADTQNDIENNVKHTGNE